MITSYEVGAIFKIADQAMPTIAALAREARTLADAVLAAKTELAALGRVPGLSVLSRQLSGVNRAVQNVTRNAVTMNAALAGGATQAAGIMAATGAGGTPRIPQAPGGRGGGGASRRHGAGFSPHFRQSVPTAFGHASLGFGGEAGEVGMGAAASMWAVFETAKQAKAMMHQQVLMQTLGLDQDEISQATARAWQTSREVTGTSAAENLKSIGEMYSVVGLPGALALSPKLAQLDQVLSRMGKGADEGSGYVLTRATELMGKLTDPVTHQVDLGMFGRELDVMTRVVAATHGKVTPKEWLNFAKQAGPASGSLTDEGMFTEATIIQAMGGYRAGTAAAALARQFAGGIMSQRTAGALESMGIAQPGDFEVRRGGQVVAKRGAMGDLVSKLQHDPLGAIVDNIIPALEAHGIKSNEDISREIYKIIGTGPGQREVYELIRGREQIRQERARAQKGMATGEGYGALAGKDPDQVTAGFTSAFGNMLAAIGSPIMAAAIPNMIALTNAFNFIQKAVLDHPGLTTGIFGTIMRAATGGAAGILNVPQAFGFGGPPAPPAIALERGGLASSANAAPGTLNVTVKAETDQPEGLAHRVASLIVEMLHTSSVHNQAQGQGVLDSAFTMGGGVSP
jgi:hypothetical protein